MVFLEHRPRVYYSLTMYSSRSHGTVVCTTTCKGRNYCKPRDPASWGKMAAIPDDCERTATVALPTATSPGFISGEVGISAALDAFSTVYELPLTRLKKGQTDRPTDRHADMNDHYTSLCATPTRGNYYTSRFKWTQSGHGWYVFLAIYINTSTSGKKVIQTLKQPCTYTSIL